MKTVHIIPNAHLDQVWLWDWREGSNEAVATAQAVLDLMDRCESLTFAHGEAEFYKPLLTYRPDLMERIREYVASGRWDIVGGNMVQSDQNFPETATFIRQYRHGKAFFRKHFGVDVDIAWAADCAGHSAGLPDILKYSGFRYMAFSRPPESALPLPNHSFRWRGLGDAEIICARASFGYQNERSNMTELLSGILDTQSGYPQDNLFLPMGLGDHGGGPSARHVEEVLEYATTHRDVRIVFSTFSRLFRALEEEKTKLPVVESELNFFFRGVHINNAPVKHAFRDLEAAVQRATRVCAVIDCALGTSRAADLSGEWDDLLYNTFHDILPGDSIDRVNREQIRWMASSQHHAEKKEYDALTRLGSALEMMVPPPSSPDAPSPVPFLAFNPAPFPFHGLVELESCLDYRPVYEHYGHPEKVRAAVRNETGCLLPAQNIETEHAFMRTLPWRKRELFMLDIPPFGYRRLTMGIARDDELAPEERGAEADAGQMVCSASDGKIISNGRVSVRAEGNRLFFEKNGQSVTGPNGMSFAVFADRYGSWGEMGAETAETLCTEKLEDLTVATVKILEKGPLRARMLVEFSGRRSRLDLIVSVDVNSDDLDAQASLVWDERAARLKMCLDPVHEVMYQVPGGSLVRNVPGDVPGGRWLKTSRWGLASDHFSGYASLNDCFCVNMIRASVACVDENDSCLKFPELPSVDAGRHAFHFVLLSSPENAPKTAQLLEFPPILMEHWAHHGQTVIPLGFELPDESLVLLDLQPDEHGGLSALVQNVSSRDVTVTIGERKFHFAPWQILKCEGC